MVRAVLAILGLLGAPSVWGASGQLTDVSTAPTSVVAQPPRAYIVDSITAYQNAASTYNVHASSLDVRGLNQVRDHITAVPNVQQEALNGHFYMTTTNVVANGVTETPVFMFVNLSTNTLSAFLDAIYLLNLSETATVFRVYRSPVVTSSGTALGINPGYTSFAVASQMQAYRSPTLSSNGTLVFTFASGPQRVALNQSRIFVPGAKLAITADSSANGSEVAVNLEWVEKAAQ